MPHHPQTGRAGAAHGAVAADRNPPGARGVVSGSAGRVASAGRPRRAGPDAGSPHPDSPGQGRSDSVGAGGRPYSGRTSIPSPRPAPPQPGRRGRVGEPAGVLWSRLTPRDREVLDLLDRHRVLTTEQLRVLAFGSRTRAQHRLAELWRLGVLWRFRFPLVGGGSMPWHYAVGYHGARLLAAQRAVTPPAPGVHQQRLERLAESPTLRHLLGTNQFFVDLAEYAHRAGWPDANQRGGTGLVFWRSEAETTALYERRIRPDGHGGWAEGDGPWLGFYLEYDTGSEPLGKVVGKLASYTGEDDRYGGPGAAGLHGMLLFWLPTGRREAHLRAALRGRSRLMPIATAAADHHDPDGPAGPVWAVLDPGPDVTGGRRLRLGQLPDAIGGTNDQGWPLALRPATTRPDDARGRHRPDTPEPSTHDGQAPW